MILDVVYQLIVHRAVYTLELLIAAASRYSGDMPSVAR